VDLKGKLPLKEIQSDEAEGACVLFPVHPNVDPLHETIVHVVDKRSGFAGASVCPCPSPLDVRDAHQSLEIEDRYWLETMDGLEGVKKLRPWTKELGAAGNGSRSDVMVPAGMRNCW